MSVASGWMGESVKESLKKAAKWVVVVILWPILKELLVEFGKLLAKLMAEGFKSLLAKWRDRDVEAASSEAEAQAARIRYDERIKDIDEMTTRLTENVEDVVRQALLESEAKRDSVLEAAAVPKALPSPTDA
jgi:hypothetical protein